MDTTISINSINDEQRPPPLTTPSFRTEQADFFLPHSLLRMRRPAEREISLPLVFAGASHLKPTSPNVTIHFHGPYLTRLLHGQQVRRPLPRRNQQPACPRRPAQSKNPSRLHKKVQRHQARLARSPRKHPLGNLAPIRTQKVAPPQENCLDSVPQPRMERTQPGP